MRPRQPTSTLFPYTTLFRSHGTSPSSGSAESAQPTVRAAPGRPASRAITPYVATRPLGMCRTTRRSEEHTSELQSRRDLVCRLLLEKKNEAAADARLHYKLQ